MMPVELSREKNHRRLHPHARYPGTMHDIELQTARVAIADATDH